MGCFDYSSMNGEASRDCAGPSFSKRAAVVVLPLSIVLAIASGVAPEQGWFATRTSRACWRHERSRLFRIERAGQKKAIMECAHNLF